MMQGRNAQNPFHVHQHIASRESENTGHIKMAQRRSQQLLLRFALKEQAQTHSPLSCTLALPTGSNTSFQQPVQPPAVSLLHLAVLSHFGSHAPPIRQDLSALRSLIGPGWHTLTFSHSTSTSQTGHSAFSATWSDAWLASRGFRHMSSTATEPASAIMQKMPIWWPLLPTRAVPYAQLMRLDKPIGTWLLLWPSLWCACAKSWIIVVYNCILNQANHKCQWLPSH